jgi:hypothetical protein
MDDKAIHTSGVEMNFLTSRSNNYTIKKTSRQLQENIKIKDQEKHPDYYRDKLLFPTGRRRYEFTTDDNQETTNTPQI